MSFFFAEEDPLPKFVPDPKLAACDFGVLTVDTLEGFVTECIAAGKFAIDTETTGLDKRVKRRVTQDKIVGISLSPGRNKARYIPIRHRGEVGLRVNLPWSVVLRQLKRLESAMREGKLICYNFNANYDHEMLSNTGDEDPFDPWDDYRCWEDGIHLAYLANSARKQLGLKALVRSELGIEMLELAALFPQNESSRDFSSLDPTRPDVTYYACSDAICHFWIAEHFHPRALHPYMYVETKEGKKVYKGEREPARSQQSIITIEKLCSIATRWMVRNRVPIDRDKARTLIELGQREWYESVQDFYSEVETILGRDVRPPVFRYLCSKGFEPDPDQTLDEILDGLRSTARFLQSPDQEPGRVYEVTSPAQLGDLLSELGVPGLRETEKGTQIDTSQEEIERIADEHGEKFPFILKIRKARSAALAMANWLLPLYRETDTEDNTAAFSFKQLGTETGRFATPKDKNLSTRRHPDVPTGWPGMNFQSLSGPRKGRPECMNRVRECIRAPEGEVIVSVDFSAVELRIVTNISGEPKWLEAFYLCDGCKHKFPPGILPPPRCPKCGSDRIGDLHATTAISVLGASQSDPDWKDKRSKGKVLNFAMVYGGGADAACRAMGSHDKNEGFRIHKRFNESYQGLQAWWGDIIATAQQFGGVWSAFGRFIWTPEIFDKDKRLRSMGERNAKNAPIQATSADITKLAMGLVYRKFKELGWLETARLIACMHDELVFSVRLEILEEMIRVTRDLMTRNPILLKQNWPVLLSCDVEIGRDWTVPWNLLEILYGEVRFKGDKKYKSPEDAAKNGLVWDEMERFPDTLRPYFKNLELINKPPQEKKETPPPRTGLLLVVPSRSDLFVEKLANLLASCPGEVPIQIEAGGKLLEGTFMADPNRIAQMSGKFGVEFVPGRN